MKEVPARLFWEDVYKFDHAQNRTGALIIPDRNELARASLILSRHQKGTFVTAHRADQRAASGHGNGDTRGMSALVIDGRKLASEVVAEAIEKASSLPRRPGLAVVIVGDDPASHIYVRGKQKRSQEAGFSCGSSCVSC